VTVGRGKDGGGEAQNSRGSSDDLIKWFSHCALPVGGRVRHNRADENLHHYLQHIAAWQLSLQHSITC